MRLFLFLFIFPFLVISQRSLDMYFVIHVEGQVTYSDTKKLVKVNDEIKENTKINYVTIHDFIVVSKLDGEERCLHPNAVNVTSAGFWELLSLNNLKNLTDLPSRGDGENAIPFLFFKKGKLMNPKKIRIVKVPKDKDSYYYLNIVARTSPR
jgi:hypothetical protein